MTGLQVVRAFVVGAALSVSGVALAGPTSHPAPVKKVAKADAKEAAKTPTKTQKSTKKAKHPKHASKAKTKPAKTVSAPAK